MFQLKTRLVKFRKALTIFILVQMLATLFSFNLANPSGQAAAQNYSPSFVYSVEVTPADNSVWVLWRDSNLGDFAVNHFDSEGKLLTDQRFTFPELLNSSFSFEIGVDFSAVDAPRVYYYVQNAPNRTLPPTSQKIVELNLANGNTRSFLNKDVLAGCGRESFYDAASQQIYLTCPYHYNEENKDFRLLVIDVIEGKVLKTINQHIVPLAFKPGMSKFYAQKFHSDKPEKFDIVTYNAATGEQTQEPALLENLDDSKSNAIGFLQVNSRTGKIYLQTRCCADKFESDTFYVFDKENKKLFEGTPQVNYISLMNEAANQMYGTVYTDFSKNPKPTYEQAAFSLDNPQAPRLAGYDWNLYAVDGRGYIYGALKRSFSDNMPKSDAGLALVVINPNTFSVMRTISLRSPDKYYQDKAARIGALPANFSGRFFPETGHTLTGKFLDYWEKNGGLTRFGYPITEPFEEYNPQVDKVLTVQYFERNRFEIHPENVGTQYEVLLGVLGRNFSAFTGPRPDGSFQSGETSAVPGGLYFKQTGHTLTGKFYDYWKANGGLAQHGLPLSEPTKEVNPIDGKTYTVQYFERSRLEIHPENAGTPYEVLMGHFGVQFLRSQGWLLSV